MSAGHAVQGPDFCCDQHEKLQKIVCNYAVNNRPIGEVSSLMPSVISELIPSSMKVGIPSAFLTWLM